MQDKSLAYREGRKLIKYGADQLKQMMSDYDGSSGQLRLLIKIKPSDVDAHGSQRQRVDGACRVFSQSVANFYQLHNQPDEAELIRTINNWFDVLNSRYGEGVRSCYGLDLAAQDSALDKMLKV